MAEPKLQIEQYVEELEKRVKNCETAIHTMAHWLVQARRGFNAQDAEGIVNILKGEYVEDRTGGSFGTPEKSGTDEEAGISVEMKREQGGTDVVWGDKNTGDEG